VQSFQHGLEKPAPALFLAACEALGIDPEATLMVGDSHVADGGGVLAGLTTLLRAPVPPGRPRGLDLVLALFQAPLVFGRGLEPTD
jgi:FMN phosphatase YigB (HAD superfamily)